MRLPVRQQIFALAERLGMTADQVRSTVTSAELTEWRAYDQVVCPQEWYRAAVIAQTVSNRLRGENERASDLYDFMPVQYRPVMSPEKVSENLKRWATRGQIGG